jgi:aromatic-L-amino-acid decarboxylase
MGLVCFRLCGSDKINQELLANINGSGKLHMIPSIVRGKYIIRFCVVAENSTDEDIGKFHILYIHSFYINMQN